MIKQNVEGCCMNMKEESLEPDFRASTSSETMGGAKNSEPADCVLCEVNKQDELSHIIPKFIVKKLMRESDSGRYRSAGNPNVVWQDGKKLPLLCPKCEDLLSKWEKHFAQTIFHPSYQGALPQQTGCGDAIALKFLASLSFRGIAYALSHNEIPSNLRRSHEYTLNVLRDFLLDRRKDTLPLYHELYYVTDAFDVNRRKYQRILYYYLKTGIDQDYLITSDGMLQYVTHFGPFLCVLTMENQMGISSEDARIFRDGFLTYSLKLETLPSTLLTFINEGTKLVAAAQEKLSQRQSSIIAANWKQFLTK